MAIRLRGGTISADVEVESLTKALRVTQRPLDYGAGGAYKLTSKSGVMADGLAASAPVYAFRVANAGLVAVVRRVRLAAWIVTPATDLAGTAIFDLMVARSWTAADTDGTTDTLTTNNGKLRTSMASIAALSEIRHSSTATLTAGTRTLDAQPIEVVVAEVRNSELGPFFVGNLFERSAHEHPLVLAENEGFVVQATVPSSFTWTFAITTDWDEVATY
jgi:hypothetical protein